MIFYVPRSDYDQTFMMLPVHFRHQQQCAGKRNQSEGRKVAPIINTENAIGNEKGKNYLLKSPSRVQKRD